MYEKLFHNQNSITNNLSSIMESSARAVCISFFFLCFCNICCQLRRYIWSSHCMLLEPKIWSKIMRVNAVNHNVTKVAFRITTLTKAHTKILWDTHVLMFNLLLFMFRVISLASLCVLDTLNEKKNGKT